LPVFVTASAASVLAGPVGWLLGSLLGRFDLVQRMFVRYRISAFLERYGFWAVAVAALTPFPFSLATWASGAARVPLRTVLLGSLFRIPKVLFYFSIIVFGWDLVPMLAD
jgi:membrane protein YqaA with SNARE-associated domain